MNRSDHTLHIIETTKAEIAENTENIDVVTESSGIINEWSSTAHGRKITIKDFPSSSNPNIFYQTIQWEDGVYSCSCPGWTRGVRGGVRNCKHVKAMGGAPYVEGEANHSAPTTPAARQSVPNAPAAKSSSVPTPSRAAEVIQNIRSSSGIVWKRADD